MLRFIIPMSGAVFMALLISIGLPTSLQAQDPSFSQFYANRIYLNPAFAGLERGITATAAARMQWHQVDKGFRTYNFSVETQLPVIRLGLALHLLKNTEGIGDLTTNQAGVVLSYTIPGDRNNFHFGMEARLVQKTIDWDKFLFSDQLDPVFGVVRPSTLVPLLDKTMYGDFDFGVVWRHDSKLTMGNNSFRKIRSHLGLSFHHLPYLFSKSAEGNDSFFNTGARVAPRTTFHGGMIIPITFLKGTGMDIAFSPNFKLDMQGNKFLNLQENITVGTLGMYTLVNSFYVGLLYQNRFFGPSGQHTDAFILTLGGYANSNGRQRNSTPNLFFGISADFNSTGVGPSAGSVFEVTLRYRFLTDANIGGRLGGRSGRGSSKRVLDCKSFF